MDMTETGETPEAEVPVSTDNDDGDDVRGGYIAEGLPPSKMSLPPDAKGEPPQEPQEMDGDSAE